MAFKVFDAYGAASRPEATLRQSGYLFLSKGILKRAGNESATHAQLMFDEEKDRLGVKLHTRDTVEGEPGTRELSTEKSGASITVLPLIRYYGLLDPQKVGKRVLSVTFEDDLIVIDLKSLRPSAGDDEEGT